MKRKSKKSKPQGSYRSSKTGRFVTEKYANRHQATTYLDTIKKKKPRIRLKDSEDSFNEG